MRAAVLCGRCSAWEAAPRSAAELKEAATHYPYEGARAARRAAPCSGGKRQPRRFRAWCRSQARAM
eukprot:scaffold38018_cov59-Phaeocystis_antarctica.AAC.4